MPENEKPRSKENIADFILDKYGSNLDEYQKRLFKEEIERMQEENLKK